MSAVRDMAAMEPPKSEIVHQISANGVIIGPNAVICHTSRICSGCKWWQWIMMIHGYIDMTKLKLTLTLLVMPHPDIELEFCSPLNLSCYIIDIYVILLIDHAYVGQYQINTGIALTSKSYQDNSVARGTRQLHKRL